ncbi:DNA-3-methyladenine glycosylase 2 family protein [Arsenicitalea aurantiaca]|uniref:DNA-3-methyladenine glycosylase II n=1 Tax=Arsenicitalea aurantiaca TaxID=1783274 RepID=A0A433X5R6_9HYPH|nr:DNA-3-methyladenine glycosylase [Arsenicitalea aurantiaca]RUT29402.1 DNA-3-methyladenine glycosylase 2 family protein [Arsenicitalea aurantiaca]
MSGEPALERLETEAILARHLAGLLARDERLVVVAERAGPLMPRLSVPGFEGLAKTVCGQQLSVASARAIWARFAEIEGATDPRRFLLIDEGALRATGFSKGKIATLRAAAEAIVTGSLDLFAIEALPVADAVAALTSIRGVGPWTAEIYLMFCAGHPDIFPAGDLALQKAVAHGLGLDGRPDIATLSEIATLWAPHRATAALLFWRYFAALREREGIAL